ncbi:MAG TPA: isoprenylcysteine carboxylmethyltransferase family protein [Candidatus Sulfopaludibacter sp.]|jgi:protein-S-isoprenylcysteine O-methyltransferase Ste14|nr:isoprenylcysteine carboxylmethyltransferase family protein [Candidatus Sulfopaludibacter sp.]
MGRTKIILYSALFGAAVGAVATLPKLRGLTSTPLLVVDRVLAHRPEFVLAVLGWAAFSIHWELAAKSAPARVSESSASRGLHVFLANAALLLTMAPLHGWGRFAPLPSLLMPLGVALEAAGLFLAIWARRHLGRNWSGEISIREDHQLIRTGPYRTLRHPIYTGLLAMYAGATLVTGEWLAVAGFLMAALAYWRKIVLEEANLKSAFGADYDAYCRDSWALLPGLL